MHASLRCASTKPFLANRKCKSAAFARISLKHRLPSRYVSVQATEGDGPQTSRASVDDEVPPTDDISRLAAQRRQQQAEISKDTNLVQGALEEAQLITWPKPQKALLDTVLVLFIVAGSGAMLFGMNVLLAELSEWWYHLG